MPAFGPIWGDVDRTRPGTPYVVDDDGWGWFFLFILFTLPFFLLWILLYQTAGWICQHPYITGGIYLLLSSIIGLLLYSGKPWLMKILGIITTILTLIPLAMVQALYLIPSLMISEAILSMVFEWLLTTFVVAAITLFILS
ncbi:MAG: hypothetical protein ACI4L5_05335 [Negativibacillus sp.]